ncbi:putative membrane protein insertion efficiency factor [Agromyces terreus]|uniref:Putative membrane protein insertion efficiency factor n=1 Tax=Agromyces terreus TaxID=424795 RepID=A0A9X2GWH6_9MICO|nr:membrane protein insertion efficiency factor YidD [Agromyces terreus]MCP2370350.1 putative membrane protein insertion efficiency factor [Agromyces terreus]
MRDALLFIVLIPRNLGVLLIRGYRAVISPLYGDVCRYYPSCSAYGLGSVQQRGLFVGSALTAWRILRCNPWTAGGIDDVRPAAHTRYATTPFGWVLPRAWAPSPAGLDRPLDRNAHASHDGCDAASEVLTTADASAPTMSRKD